MQILIKYAIGAVFVMLSTSASNAFAIPSGQNKNYEGSSNSSWGSSEDQSVNSKYKTPSSPREFPKGDKGWFSEDSPKYSGGFDDSNKKKYGYHENENEIDEEDEKEHHPKGYGSVPEPTSVLLLGAGLAGLGIWRRKVS